MYKLVIGFLSAFLLAGCTPQVLPTVKIVLIVPEFLAPAIRLISQAAQDATANSLQNAAIEIEIKPYDLSIPQDDMAEVMRAVANDQRVVAALGPESSSILQTVLPITNRAGLVELAVAATYPGLTRAGYAAGHPAVFYPSGERTFFRMSTTDDIQGAAAARWARSLEKERVFIVAQDDTYGQTLARFFRQQAEELGLEISGEVAVSYSPEDATLVDIFAAIERSPATMIYAALESSPSLRLFNIASVQHNTIPIMVPSAIFSSVIDAPVYSEDYAIYATATLPSIETLNEEGSQLLERIMEQDLPWSTVVFRYYDALTLVLHVLKSVPDPTSRDQVRVAIATLESTPSVFGQTYRFDENGDITFQSVSGYRLTQEGWQFEADLFLPEAQFNK